MNKKITPFFFQIRNFFTSQYWLIISISGAFFTFFALNRGGVVVFIEAGFFFLVINLVLGGYRLREIPPSYWVTLAICAFLLATNILLHPDISRYSYKRMANLLRMLCVVFTIHCLSQKRIESWVLALFAGVVSMAVCWQVVAFYMLNRPFGTFTNPHYLSSFSMLALPALVYFILTTRDWYKFIFVPIALLDADLLLRIGSRPAILCVTFGGLFVLIFLTKGKPKWIGLLLMVAVGVILYVTQYVNIMASIEKLFVNFLKDERVQLGMTSWDMLKENSLASFIVGNGIGSFRAAYPQYAVPELKHLTFPHFHLIEILYENGIGGAVLVFGGILLLFVSAIKFVRRTENRKKRYLVQCMLVILISWIIHTGLTFPFYSKYTQYSLSFILGILIPVMAKPRHRRVEISN